MLHRWYERSLVFVGSVGPRLAPVRYLVLAAALVPALAWPVLAQGERYFSGRPFGGPFGPGPWMLGVTMLFRLIFVVAIFILLWRLFSSRGPVHASDSAVQILRDRYAKGEISEDEYRKRLTLLTS